MIVLDSIRKAYGQEQVLDRVSFRLPAGQTLSVLGKSGSGKSTLLKVMAGLEEADAGSFTLGGEDMLALPPQKRGVVYLSQEPLLFPHLSVADNLAFGLKIRKTPKAEAERKSAEMAERLGLSEHLRKMPHQLSGGQRQRASFGRALMIGPRVLLLDEPFGSLDAHTRAEMQRLFQEIKQAFAITALFVTHDLKEALLMGDRFAYIESGSLTLYPSAQAFVASGESGAAAEIDFWKAYAPPDDE